MGWDGPILTDSGGLPGRVARRPAGHRRRRRDLQEPPRRVDPPVHAGALDRRSSRRSGRTSRSRSTSRCSRARRGPSSRDAMDRTHRWAERSLAAHTRTDQALFGIVQGGLDPGLRAESARFIASLPFDGINIGGLAGDETPEERNATLDATVAAPRRRPARPLPDGPRLAARPAGGRPPRHRPVRLGAAGEGRAQRAAVDPGRPPATSATSSTGTTRGRSRRTVRAPSARGSRGPI